MAKIALCYDVSGHHTDVKAELFSMGYSDRWNYNGETFYLPNTTVWKKDVTTEQAINALKKAVENINSRLTANNQVKIERGVAMSFDGWWAFYGDPYATQRTAPTI